MHQHRSSGQVLLITLLVLTVGMTISLALISRTRTDISINNEIEDSARAFAAAEAGIERALQTGQSSSSQPLSGNLASYSTNISAIAGTAASYAIPQLTTQGNTESVWLVNHNEDGSLDETRVYTSNTIDVCWRGTQPPALSIGILYKNAANTYLLQKVAYDPNSRGNFANAGILGAGCGQSNVYRQTINFNSLGINPSAPNDTLLALRIRPIYADANIFVAPPANVTLPSQGNIITSTGVTGSGVSRKIVVSRQFRSAPSIFDAAVVSELNFSH